MIKKKKEEINVEVLELKQILEEAVVCSRLGRTIASFGATLINREKQDAKLVYLLLRYNRKLPKRTLIIAKVSKDKKSKKVTYAQAVKWFTKNYPKEAQPLLAKLKEAYDATETSVVYGVHQGKDILDGDYIKVLIDILEIPQQDAAVMYYGAIKPQIQRLKEGEGLVRVVMK